MRDRMRRIIITLLVVIAMMIGIMPFENREIIADGEDVQEITSVTLNVPRPRVGQWPDSPSVAGDQPYEMDRFLWLFNNKGD